MNETQRNIEAYKAALPGLKERVFAVALLLVMSVAMMTSATFAWITLSRAPEVSNVTTNISANGNLEIALVKPDGSLPDESAVGDSSAADGRNIVDANLTWGNLVNLADASYGLSDIVLRPALLGNTDDLVSQPLKGVDYGKDGRLEQYYNEDYQFANYIINNDGSAFFKYNDPQQYGVRAISTVEYTYVNTDIQKFYELLPRPTSVQAQVIDEYNAMIAKSKNLNVLANLISVYLDDELNGGGTGTTNAAAYVSDAYDLALEFEGIVNNFGDALFELANLQIYNHYGSKNYENNLYKTTEEFFADRANWASKGIQIDCIDEYDAIKATIQEVVYGEKTSTGKYTEDRDGMAEFNAYLDPAQGGSTSNVVTIKELLDVMDKLVTVNTCHIYLKGIADPFTVDTLTSFVYGLVGDDLFGGASKLLDYIKDVRVVIQDGTLKDFEQLTDAEMDAQGMVIPVSFKKIPIEIEVKHVTCEVDRENILFEKDIAATKKTADENKGDYTGVAQDTYGLAMDYWVRTNASDSYLTLEGNVMTNTETVRAMGADKNGEEAELFTVKVTTSTTDNNGQPQSFEETVEVYILTERENEEDENSPVKEAIYNANTHMRIAFDGVATIAGQTVSKPTPLMRENVTVIGYEGENRIWDDQLFMSTDSTTQGNGSCYVFYAEDVAQQENSLRLLSNLRVAFVDNNADSPTYSKLVGLAKLDTERPYEENGKVTLPLVLFDDSSDYLTKTEDDGLAIMKLEQNVATKLLTLVYLDGRNISNADVFAAGDIQGQLNIQFGSTMELTPIEDEDLASQKRTISAVAKKHTAAEYGSTETPITFDYGTETDPMSVDVKVTVEGDHPTNVAAIIMRQVNATQGSFETALPLTETAESGVYEGTYTFTYPGNYIIRSVRMDGIDYNLPADKDTTTNKEYPRVEISGFGMEYVKVAYDGVNVGEGTKKIMTDKKSVSADVSVKLAADQSKMPRSLQLQFAKAGTNGDTLITANMGYNATTGVWSGSANFTASGEYVLQYIIMDGQYDELAEQYRRTLDITLGMKVRVRDTDAALRDKIWEGTPYSVPIIVEIRDEGNNMVPYLDVVLKYGTSASSVDAVDPPLRWNASKNQYDGHLWISHPGIHKFIGVEVSGGNPLTTTTSKPPEFICRSNDPVEFLDAEPTAATSLGDLDFEIVGNTIKTGVRLKNASTAKLSAIFYNEEDGKEYTVIAGDPILDENGNPTSTNDGYPATTYQDTETGEMISEFVFKIPAGPKNNQAGKWTLKKLKLVDVTGSEKDANGFNVYHNETNPLYVDMVPTDTNDLQVRIAQVVVTAAYTKDAPTAFTGSFMQSATTSPLTITIVDHNGNALVDADGNYLIDQLSLQYQLRTNSWSASAENYGGGYTADHLGDASGAGELDTYTITSTDGKTFTLNAVTLTYAGIYDPSTMSFEIKGIREGQSAMKYSRGELETMGMPAFYLKTTKPNVVVSSVTPTTANMPISITWVKSRKGLFIKGDALDYTLNGSVTNGVDTTTNTVTAYARAATSGVPNVGNGDAGFEQPTIKFKVENVDASSTVKFTIPKGEANVAYNFSKTGNGESSAITLGALWKEQEVVNGYLTVDYTLWGYKGHGSNISIDVITIERNSQTFKVGLDKPIKIINPSSVNRKG